MRANQRRTIPIHRRTLLSFEILEDRRLLAGGLLGALEAVAAPVPNTLAASESAPTIGASVDPAAAPVAEAAPAAPDVAIQVPDATIPADMPLTDATADLAANTGPTATIDNQPGLEFTLIITSNGNGLSVVVTGTFSNSGNFNGGTDETMGGSGDNSLLPFDGAGGAGAVIPVTVGVIVELNTNINLDKPIPDVDVGANGTPLPGLPAIAGLALPNSLSSPATTSPFTIGPRNSGSDALVPQVPTLDGPGIPGFPAPELLFGSPIAAMAPFAPGGLPARAQPSGVDAFFGRPAHEAADMPLARALVLLQTEGTGPIGMERHGPSTDGTGGSQVHQTAEALIPELQLPPLGADLLGEPAGLDLAGLQQEVDKLLAHLVNLRQDVLTGPGFYAWALALGAAAVVANECRRQRARRATAVAQALTGTALPWFLALSSAPHSR